MWIDFFESKGHKYIKGVSLIPEGDKSLLWVNAGVTGLKKYFDGSEIPPCRRIVNVQKSIRTNDIENVGHTARHHTFFEMLGNFSIGDYFRKEVIEFAVEILTSPKWFDMELDKLYITYNPDDKEAYEYWRQHGVKADHLIPLESNYWQIGEGPCGPNTEVFYDRGEDYDPEHLGVKLLQNDMENDRYIEIWGIVFSQYNAVNGVERKDYKELPSKNIDTGSGLERIACILQGTKTNFETDLFLPIIERTKQLCGKPYEGEYLLPYRVIADHARCLTFALSDGARFSNEGRGYVLRRIIRRAARFAQRLGIHEPFMAELVQTVVDEYSDFYPELKDSEANVKKLVSEEERKFSKTLLEGEAMLKKMVEGKKELSGEDAFKLYDTYGFPLDLTLDITKELGIEVDVDGFDKLMDEQKERARSARGEIESFHKQSKDLLSFDQESVFDYDDDEVEARITGLFVDGVAVEQIDKQGEVATDLTPFYSESGGQIGDKGAIASAVAEGKVVSVGKAPRGQHLHFVELERGALHLGDKVKLRIDSKARRLSERNHSATHLLHAAISEVLNTHVEQKGSYVCPDYLRFDFTSDRKLSEEQLDAIEKRVNELIGLGIKEETKILPIDEAKKLGAEMEFSEKYGETVRVVCFGDYSKEFCGGTHVKNSSDIGLFVIVSESSIGSGLRRIEARSSEGAFAYLKQKASLLSKLSASLGGNEDEAPARLASLQGELDKAKKEIAALQGKLSGESASSLADKIEDVNGVGFLSAILDADRNGLMKVGDALKSNRDDYLLILASSKTPKAPLVCFASGKGEKLGAGNAMKLIAPLLYGNGGGSSKLASGSINDLSKFDIAVAEVKEKLGE